MRQRSSKTRYFIRTDKASIGFVPWGLVGLLCTSVPIIYGLSRFANSDIEDKTRANVEKTLENSGLEWVKVDVDGQHVTLSGKGPNNAEASAEALRALQLAEETQGGTWLGLFKPAITVTGDFDFDSAAGPATIVPAQVLPSEWGDFYATLDEGKFSFEGSVASAAEQRAVIYGASMKRLSHPQAEPELSHEIIIDPKVREGSMELAMLATELLSHCKNGSTRVDEGKLSLDCQTSPEGAQEIRSLQSKPLAHGQLGNFSVNVIKSCQQNIEGLIKDQHINFAFDSAIIPASANEFLDAVANMMQNCKGVLRIDGHTDSTGPLDYNMFLSFKRAMATIEQLVARGVDRKYLVANALGPNNPRAPGQDKQAKAENRRVEFNLLLQGEL